jgi:hypothetical protein
VVNNIPVHSGHETVLEATYRFHVNDSFYLQPIFSTFSIPVPSGTYRTLWLSACDST